MKKQQPKKLDTLDYKAMTRFLEGPCSMEAERFLASEGFLRCNSTDNGDFGNAIARLQEHFEPKAELALLEFTDRNFIGEDAKFAGEDPGKAVWEVIDLEMDIRMAVMQAAYFFGLAVGRRIGPATINARRTTSAHRVKPASKRRRAA